MTDSWEVHFPVFAATVSNTEGRPTGDLVLVPSSRKASASRSRGGDRIRPSPIDPLTVPPAALRSSCAAQPCLNYLWYWKTLIVEVYAAVTRNYSGLRMDCKAGGWS
jgi:hypothetical protein